MKQTLKQAFISTIPVLIRYLVLGFGFGIVLKANGLGIVSSVVCLIVFEGENF